MTGVPVGSGLAWKAGGAEEDAEEVEGGEAADAPTGDVEAASARGLACDPRDGLLLEDVG